MAMTPQLEADGWRSLETASWQFTTPDGCPMSRPRFCRKYGTVQLWAPGIACRVIECVTSAARSASTFGLNADPEFDGDRIEAFAKATPNRLLLDAADTAQQHQHFSKAVLVTEHPGDDPIADDAERLAQLIELCLGG